MRGGPATTTLPLLFTCFQRDPMEERQRPSNSLIMIDIRYVVSSCFCGGPKPRTEHESTRIKQRPFLPQAAIPSHGCTRISNRFLIRVHSCSFVAQTLVLFLSVAIRVHPWPPKGEVRSFPLSSNNARQRAAGAGVQFFRHAAGLVGQAAGFYREIHRAGHFDGVFGRGDGRVH